MRFRIDYRFWKMVKQVRIIAKNDITKIYNAVYTDGVFNQNTLIS